MMTISQILLTSSIATRRASAAACLAVIVFCHPFGANARQTDETNPQRAWTLPDIVGAPEIIDVSMSSDGRYAMYVIRRADLRANAKISTLHLVNLSTGFDQTIKNGTWFEQLDAIPQTRDWSMLANIGDGVQLYRVDLEGNFTPLVINKATAFVGPGIESMAISPNEGPQKFGVRSYGWSANGTNLWYITMAQHPLISDRVVNPDRMPLRAEGLYELRVLGGDGADISVYQGPGDQRGVNPLTVVWDDQSSSLFYSVRQDDPPRFTVFRRDLSANSSILIKDERRLDFFAVSARGPVGGRLETKGWGINRELVESSTAKLHSYGKVNFVVGDPRSSGSWRSADGKFAIVGTRYVDNPRYGLVRLDIATGAEEVINDGSLTNCSFDTKLSIGVCVRQSMMEPPELVTLNPRKGGVNLIARLASEYSVIKPLKVTPWSWINRNGYSATGYLVYPRDYIKGQRYPAILVTHGSDADELFVSTVFQWNYPVQVWAERGYVVICINDPSPSQAKKLAEAYAQWSAPGKLTVAQVQDAIWLNPVASFEDAVKELMQKGLVDGDRVGIAGYSRGSQMVNVTMTQSRMFRAASSGDGGYLEPSGYITSKMRYQQHYGGSPYQAKAVENYRRLSPTFRAGDSNGPVLQQIASGSVAQQEFFVALRDAKVPSEVVYYPRESHLFHVPQNRLSAMVENIDWFDFWLKDFVDPNPAKVRQYNRWRLMREEYSKTVRHKSVDSAM
jgi:dipeptidyl aminopeptidase/acylaminoacyl peptidase